jgi:c-di-GMP-binding flagellar brake protein YcgR
MTLESKQVFDDLSSPEFRQYAVIERDEIATLIARMAGEHAQTSIYFSVAPGSIISTVLAVDSRQGTILFDRDSDPARNDALMRAPALAWRSSLDGITIEFTTTHARAAAHGGSDAFLTLLPDMVLRLQRRNAFRAEAPITPPLHALLDESGQGSGEEKATVLDISALGMCLLVDLRAQPLVAGMRIVRVRFQLPGFGEILCGLEVRYILSAGSRHPDFMRRCGVRFVDMGVTEELLIARYINALERDRARAKGTVLGALS